MRLNFQPVQLPQNLWEFRKLPAASRLLSSTRDTSTRFFWFFEVHSSSAGGDANRNREDNTGFTRCKEEYGEPNLACGVSCYTIYCGPLALGSTTSCDVGCVSSFPRNSHIATTMPPTSPINCLIDFLFSNQCSGSKSPSRAPATFTEIFPGKTCRKIYRVRRV